MSRRRPRNYKQQVILKIYNKTAKTTREKNVGKLLPKSGRQICNFVVIAENDLSGLNRIQRLLSQSNSPRLTDDGVGKNMAYKNRIVTVL